MSLTRRGCFISLWWTRWADDFFETDAGKFSATISGLSRAFCSIYWGIEFRDGIIFASSREEFYSYRGAVAGLRMD
jgi:hypothetical protein